MTGELLSFREARAVTLETLHRLKLAPLRVDVLRDSAPALGETDLRKCIRYQRTVPLSTVIHELAHVVAQEREHGPRFRGQYERLVPVVRAVLSDMRRATGPASLTSKRNG